MFLEWGGATIVGSLMFYKGPEFFHAGILLSGQRRFWSDDVLHILPIGLPEFTLENTFNVFVSFDAYGATKCLFFSFCINVDFF